MTPKSCCAPLSLGAALLLLLAGAGTATAAEPSCGPFEPYEASGPATCNEPGLSGTSAPGAQLPVGAGELERLPAALPQERELEMHGEVLLALPKRADGTIDQNFVLAPGARIAGSFFSPVLCASIARIVGPADGSSVDGPLVEKAPPGGAIVPHHRYVGAGAAVRPFVPDPYAKLQYSLGELGAEAAWPVSDGTGATVALIDSMPAVEHPELRAVEISLAPGGLAAESAGTHGTMMAGVIAAERGNGFGIAGVAPGASVVAIPSCKPAAQGGTADDCALYDVLRGLDHAWDRRAQIVNLSIVGPSNPLLERAVARLEQLGVALVAAAGNEGTRRPRYPAAYPQVLGVGALDQDGRAYRRSNSGLSVSVAAPGVEVLSTTPPEGFSFADGTSIAAAHVSGVLAVLVSAGFEPLAARDALLEIVAPPLNAELAELGASRDPRAIDGLRVSPICDVFGLLGRSCN